MKLTKIESYEIQAFAFLVMTGYVAPGKDVSQLSYEEASHEERCAAWDEWRNKHAHCILAMLLGFEALIDRDDGPTGALLDRLKAAEAEIERLRTATLSALSVLEELQGGCTDSGDGTTEAITVWCPEVIDALRAALENTDAR